MGPLPRNADLNVVLKTALDAVVVMRLDGTVAGWNDVAERSFGWSFAEARGRRMGELIVPPQHRDAHEKGLARFLETGEGPVLDRHIEITAMHRDGRELPVELSITLTDQFGEKVFLGFLRDITERHEARRRQDLLIAELSHRVKNMLAVVAGIAQQTARKSATVEEFSDGFLGRLGSLAAAHDLLSVSRWSTADLGGLAEKLLGPYAKGPAPQASYEGPELHLSPKQTLAIGMVLHELITNATKYGALSAAAGRVRLSWRARADRREAELLWTETGMQGIGKPPRSGFGTRMLEASARHELNGRVDMDWLADGLRLKLVFPMSAAEAAPC